MNIHTTIIEKDGLARGNKFLGDINLDISCPPRNRYQAGAKPFISYLFQKISYIRKIF